MRGRPEPPHLMTSALGLHLKEERVSAIGKGQNRARSQSQISKLRRKMCDRANVRPQYDSIRKESSEVKHVNMAGHKK